MSRVNSIVDECTQYIEEFRLRDYALVATSEMMRVTTQYLKFKDVPREERDSSMAYAADIWIRLMAPMTPHLSEELWSKMKREGYVTCASWPTADKKLIDDHIEKAIGVIESTIRDTREIMKLLKSKTVAKLHVYVAPQWMFDAMNSIREAKLQLIVGEIMKHLMAQPELRTHGKEIKSIVDRIAKENGLWDYSESAEAEMDALNAFKDYMSSELGMQVVVHGSEKPDYDPQNKARFSLPGRVSLLLE
jgi:leucyl-tRNA synthetase